MIQQEITESKEYYATSRRGIKQLIRKKEIRSTAIRGNEKE